jgi:hypothetical protein
MLKSLQALGFEIEFHSHARAILSQDFPEALTELNEVLKAVSIPIGEIVKSGGGEAAGTQRLRKALTSKGWKKGSFEIKKIVNGVERESISHEIDHVRRIEAWTLALEIEWNNKDPFFDRDLENFKRLHSEGAISAGIIVTRGTTLQAALKPSVLRFANENKIKSFVDLAQYGAKPPTDRQRREVEGRVARGNNFQKSWSSFFVSDKFGEATTHWRKLQDRVHRGVGNPCPLLLIGLPAKVIAF